MNIHEYQSKQIFKEYGLPVPNFLTANTTEEVLAFAKEISDTNWVVKAQVHAGGRGKAGGVKVTDNLKEVEEFADKWINNKLVTYQTDDQGQPVSCILVEECTEIKKEFYLDKILFLSQYTPLLKYKILADPDHLSGKLLTYCLSTCRRILQLLLSYPLLLPRLLFLSLRHELEL